MIGSDKHDELVARLMEAEASRQKIALPTQTYPGFDLADAYAVQSAWMERRVADGARIIGHKIGLTSRVMQRTSKIDEPDYGHLLDDMLFSDGDSIPAARFLWPRVEVELAFVLGKALKGPNATLFDVLNATDYVVPSIEIIDYRTEAPRKIFDTVADNGAAAGLIIGGRPVRPHEVDLRWVGAALSKNGVIEESGLSAAVLGHPGLGIAWLANKIAPHGGALESGHIVLSGSFTRPIEVVSGDVIHADFGPLGAIGVSFT